MKETERHEFVDHPFVDDDSCYDAWHGGLCGQPKDAPVHQPETEATGPEVISDSPESAKYTMDAVYHYDAGKALYEALTELLTFGVELDDERMSYVVAQIDRNALADARKALKQWKDVDQP